MQARAGAVGCGNQLELRGEPDDCVCCVGELVDW